MCADRLKLSEVPKPLNTSSSPQFHAPHGEERDWPALYREVREKSIAACEPLEIEDYSLQADAFASPPKWHLAHTSWFFETFILKPFCNSYQTPNPIFEVLFNSYYNGVGEQFPRGQRGLLSRPTVAEVMAYRRHIDSSMNKLLEQQEHPDFAEIISRCRLGIEHEKQHQELFFTDIKYSLSINPLFPAYLRRETLAETDYQCDDLQWLDCSGGLIEIGVGTDDENHFAFDNEGPRHQVFLQPFKLANRLVSNREYLDFIEDDGYQRPEFWLADGWAVVQEQGWRQPLYWHHRDGELFEYTLNGFHPLQQYAPVTHVSGYEADAYANWAKARLPTEQEWECAAALHSAEDAISAGNSLHPRPAKQGKGLQQLFGECWQWTGSAYRPYPGFKAAGGAIGEYNGKFMCNQWVLRGSSCVTSAAHSRISYRNFFYPQDRWQLTGIRLAKD